MNIWMIQETREIEQTLQSVVSGWALTMPAVFFYTRKLGCNSRSNDKTPFWLVDQEQNSIWFVWVSPAPCISPLRELSLTSDRSAFFYFFLSVCDSAPPTLRTTGVVDRCNARFIVIHLDGDGHIATPWQHPSPWWNAHPSPSESWTDTDVHLSIFVTFSDTNG